MPAAEKRRPIGVFDSGVGGLTVVKALREHLPREDIFYIGDTARVPYGGKSPATLERYSMEIAGLLLAEDAKLIVVACNSACASALPRLRDSLKVPVVGVIHPGAQAAARASKTGRIGVIGTRATVQSRAYEEEILRLRPDAVVLSEACPLFVPLVEEGLFDDPMTHLAAEKYLTEMARAGVDSLVLGCTHYPLLRPMIGRFMGTHVALIDSAETCAFAVEQRLMDHDLMNAADAAPGDLHIALTDAPGQFFELATATLGLGVKEVESRRVQTYAFTA
jgi:glutamate racemase